MDPTTLTTAVWDVDAADYRVDAPMADRARFLLRYAVLAPSSHNSQPWRFRVRDDTVVVAADEDRWLPVADDDRRELHVSVGCALENLCVAAEKFGFDPEVSYDEGDATGGGFEAMVRLRDRDPVSSRPPACFDALTRRYTSHAPFTEREVPAETMARFWECVEDEPGLTLTVVTDADRKAALGELQAEADEAQLADPAYRRELGHWVGTGALGSSWLAARVGRLVVTHLDLGKREGRKNSLLVDSAPVVAVLSTPTDDPAAQVRVGQCFERIALLAAGEGVAVHPMSQTLERPETRAEVVAALDLDGEVPQHLFRLGYADEAPSHTPRWPLASFVDE